MCVFTCSLEDKDTKMTFPEMAMRALFMLVEIVHWKWILVDPLDTSDMYVLDDCPQDLLNFSSRAQILQASE